MFLAVRNQIRIAVCKIELFLVPELILFGRVQRKDFSPGRCVFSNQGRFRHVKIRSCGIFFFFAQGVRPSDQDLSRYERRIDGAISTGRCIFSNQGRFRHAKIRSCRLFFCTRVRPSDQDLFPVSLRETYRWRNLNSEILRKNVTIPFLLKQNPIFPFPVRPIKISMC